MLSFLIIEKAFSFMLYNKKMPIRLWIQSYSVCPLCQQQYHRSVSPSQPQAQPLILLRHPQGCVCYKQFFFLFSHWKQLCFFSQIQSSSRYKTNLTMKKDTSLRHKSSSFECSDSKMLIWERERKLWCSTLHGLLKHEPPATIYRCLFACLLQISLVSFSFGRLKQKCLNSKR